MVIKAAGLVIYRIVNLKIQYLLLQTSRSPYHWTPPKGHLEEGENDISAAVRETFEEAGLKESDFKIFEECKRTIYYSVRNTPKEVTYILAELLNPDCKIVLSKEHQDFKWLSLEEALDIDRYQGTKDVLTYCNNYLMNFIK